MNIMFLDQNQKCDTCSELASFVVDGKFMCRDTFCDFIINGLRGKRFFIQKCEDVHSQGKDSLTIASNSESQPDTRKGCGKHWIMHGDGREIYSSREICEEGNLCPECSNYSPQRKPDMEKWHSESSGFDTRSDGDKTADTHSPNTNREKQTMDLHPSSEQSVAESGAEDSDTFIKEIREECERHAKVMARDFISRKVVKDTIDKIDWKSHFVYDNDTYQAKFAMKELKQKLGISEDENE